MAPDPSAASVPPPVTAGARDKVRLRFRKDGALRWLSHHDLMRTFERMLRRSGLPFRRTQGFNPHPRLVFALSLPVGVVGRAEVAELELDEQLPPGEVHDRLAAQCPPGLAILSTERVSPRQTAHVTGFTYAIDVPSERRDAARGRLAEALALTEWRVARQKPTPRNLNVRPFVRDLRLDDATGRLEMDLWLTPTGTARPEEVLGLMGLADLLSAGGVLERVRLELDDDPPQAGQP
ncbi:MAG: TIGR03936 family radical SAM-associated protein [Gemmataceae bacterium]